MDGKPIAIIGSAVSCGGTLATGNGSVVIGGSPHVPGPPTYTAAFDEFLAMMFNPETNTFCPEEREALLDGLNVKYEPRFPGDTVGQLKPEYRETETLISSGSALTPEQVADNLSEDLTAAYTQKVNDKNLESIDIFVKDADGNPAGGLPYYAFIADESERDGRLNAEGKWTETGLPPGRVIVHVGGDPNGNEIRQFDAALRDRLQLALQQEKTEAKRLSSELAEKPALSRQWAYQKAGVRGLWNGALGLLSASSAATVLDTYQQAVSKAWSLWRYTDDAPYVEAFTKSFSGDPYKAFVDSLGIQVLSVAPEQLAKIGEQMIFLWEDHGARSALKKFINDFQNAQEALNLQGGIEATDDELAADLLFSSLLMHAGAKLIIDASSDWETHLSGIGSQLTHLASALKVSRQRTSGVGFTPGRVDISLVRPEYKVLPVVTVPRSWVKVRAFYDDPWETPMVGAKVSLSIAGASVLNGQELPQGRGSNTYSSTESSAEATVDEPGTLLVQRVPEGEVLLSFERVLGLEQEIASIKSSVNAMLHDAFIDIVEHMSSYQSQWDEYGVGSIALSGAEGLWSGASNWFDDQADLFEVNTWIQIGDKASEVAVEVWDFTATYARERFEEIKELSADANEFIDEAQENLFNWNWWQERGEKLQTSTEEKVIKFVGETKSAIEQYCETVEEAAEKASKLYSHRQAILSLPKQIAEGDVVAVENFVDNVLADIDPQLSSDIKNNPDWSAILELIAEHDAVLTYFAYLNLFIETVPPNFYAYLGGKGGGYVLLEIVLLILCSFLSAGVATAGRIAQLTARLTLMSARVSQVGEKVHAGMESIRALVRSIETFVDAAAKMLNMGRLLRLSRSSTLKRKSKTNTTIEAKKESERRNKKCGICGKIGRETPKHIRGEVTYN